MLPETVAAIKDSKNKLEEVVTSTKPLNHDEWKAFVKITGVVATLQSIDLSKLSQLPMPEPKKDGKQPALPLEPEIECPDCHGRGTITVGDGSQGICATCKGIGKVKSKTGTSVVAEAEHILKDATKEKETTEIAPAAAAEAGAAPSGAGTAETAATAAQPVRRQRRRAANKPGATEGAGAPDAAGGAQAAGADAPADMTAARAPDTAGEKTGPSAEPGVLEQAKAAADAYNKSSEEPGAMHVSKNTLDKLVAIDSAQSLTEVPPSLRGGMKLEGTMYACVRTASVDGHTRVWCAKMVESDKFTGGTRITFDGGPSGTGFKVTYKDKEYVLIGDEIPFFPFPEAAPAPRRRGRKSKAQKEAEQKATVEQPSAT